jgi:DNA replication and repair protein RecF
MIIKNLELTNFRLHRHTKIEFSNQLNYIVGGNGQGKTSLLEAIYYLCTSKNLNQSKDQEVVSFDETFFNVKGKFVDLINNNVEVIYSSKENKKMLNLDKKNIKRASNLIGKFPVVALTPSDHSITMGPPADRRKFVDSVISQASNTYLKILIDYNKTLRQRSALLYQIKENSHPQLLDQLETWTDSLIKLGSEIIDHRIKFIKAFSEYIKDSYKTIMNNTEVPSIKYKYLSENNSANIQETFKLELNNLRNQEVFRAKNLVGPHRDEFLFTINDLDLRKYGSQGQHKTFQIALRFGEFFFLQDTIGKTPMFLMDDVFGELDAYRAAKISEFMKKIGQAFITLTDFSNFEHLTKGDDDLVINVEKGQFLYA